MPQPFSDASVAPAAFRRTGDGIYDAVVLICPTGFAGLALLWLMPLDARQQFFFQPSPALPEPLNLRFETIEERGDLAVLVAKRVEAYVCRR